MITMEQWTITYIDYRSKCWFLGRLNGNRLCLEREGNDRTEIPNFKTEHKNRGSNEVETGNAVQF